MEELKRSCPKEARPKTDPRTIDINELEFSFLGTVGSKSPELIFQTHYDKNISQKQNLPVIKFAL
jgi:hypothetical protein